MRYVEDHRRQTHSRIVENASYGLRLKGAKGLSVVDLMKLAGLTHGGFYNHFDSRAALVGEAIAFAMDQMTERWKKLAKGKADGERFEALIADYLSPRHRDDPKHGCALPTLAVDVARSSPGEQQALASKLKNDDRRLCRAAFPVSHLDRPGNSRRALSQPWWDQSCCRAPSARGNFPTASSMPDARPQAAGFGSPSEEP